MTGSSDQRQPPLPVKRSNTNRSLKIQILPQPFHSEIAYDLVKGLDNELEAMYPDWPELPHPKFHSGFVGGDKLANTDEVEHRVNPVPDLKKDTQIMTTTTTPVLENLDAGPATQPTYTSTPQSTDELTPDQTSKTHFYIVYDLTTHAEQDMYTTAVPQSISTLSKPPAPLPAIACVALRLMPYFPDHRAQTSTATPTRYSAQHTETTYAELKRLYIHPDYRGKFKQISQISAFNTPDLTVETTTLATLLISHVSTLARQTFHVDRLVLETGVRQVPAIRLYERLGWKRIPEFGDYVGAGVAQGGVSMCFESCLV